MKNRPKIQPELTVMDRFAESLSILLLLIIWFNCFYYYSKLPDIIPTHFNAAGQPDAEGKKSTLFMLPVISTFIYALMTIINFFPHTFNFPSKITPENALKQYTLATRMVRFIKVIIMFMFAVIIIMTVKTATGDTDGLGVWFTPLLVALLFVTITIFLLKLKRTSKTNN